MPLVKLTKINKVFTLGQGLTFQALYNINLELNQGELIAIIGPSGSGKSTLMNIIGLLDKPTSGAYELDGESVAQLSPDSLANLRNKKIGFIFQQFNLLPRTSSLDNVALPLIYSGISSVERVERAKQALEQVGLISKLLSKPNQLSGGEQQRVAIARALVTNPDLILADEPTGNLDTKTGLEILEILKKLNKEGKTIVLITHEKDLAKSAKRIISLKDGEILRGI